MTDQLQPPHHQPPATPKEAKARAKADKAYRKANRPFWRKKRAWLLGIVALIVVIIVIASVAGGGGSGKSSSASPSTGSSLAAASSAAASSAAPSTQFAGQTSDDVVGQSGATLTVGSLAMKTTPLKAVTDAVGSYDCSTVTYKNNGSKSGSYNLFDWSLQDPAGAGHNTTITGESGALASGDLAPGGTVSGQVCFDKVAAGKSVLLFKPPSLFSSKRGAWLNTL